MCEDYEEIEHHKIKEHSMRQSRKYVQSLHTLRIPGTVDNNNLVNKRNRNSCKSKHLPTVNVDIQVIIKKIDAIKPMKKNEYFILVIILQSSRPRIAPVNNISTMAIKIISDVGQKRCHRRR
jgi:hypothetical protein